MPPLESDNQNFSSNDGGMERGGSGGAAENPWRDDLGEIYGPSGTKPGNVNGPSGDSRPDDKSQKEQLGPGQGGDARWAEASAQGPEIKGTQGSAAADNGNASLDKPGEGNVNGQASDKDSPAQKGKDVLEGDSSGNKDKLNGFGEAVKEGVDAFKKFADEKPADSAMGDMNDHQKAEKERMHQNLPQRTPDGSQKDGPAPSPKDENTSALAQPKDMAGYKQPEMQMQENGMQPVGRYEPVQKMNGVTSPENQQAGDAGAQQQGSEAKDATDLSAPSGIKHGYPDTDAHKLPGGNDQARQPDISAEGSAQQREPVFSGADLDERTPALAQSAEKSGTKTGLPATGSELRLQPDGSIRGEMTQPHAQGKDIESMLGLKQSAPKIEEVTLGADGKPEIPPSRSLEQKSESMKNDDVPGQKFGMTDDIKKMLGAMKNTGWENVDLAKSKR